MTSLPEPRLGQKKLGLVIDLDNHPSLAADEIDDIWPDRLLPREFEPVEAAIAKLQPEHPFGASAVAP